MKQKTKLLITALALLGASFTPSFGWDWSLNPITFFGYLDDEGVTEEGVEVYNDDFVDEEIDADAEEREEFDSEEDFDPEEDVIVFNFDSLGYELLPEASHHLQGTAAEQADQIRLFIEKATTEGVLAQYISLYRANPTLAIKVLDTELEMDERMFIIRNAPAAFVGRLLSDMRKNIDGVEEDYHWGEFELKFEEVGRKDLNKALIPATARPVQYIWAMIYHGNNDSFEEQEQGAFSVYQALKTLSDDEIVNLLAYAPNEASAKIGKKQKKSCFGLLKSADLCMESTPQYLPVKFVAPVLEGFSDYTIISVLEKEEKNNPERAKEIIDLLKPAVYRRTLAYMGLSMKKKVSAENIASTNPLMEKYQKNKETLVNTNLIAPAEEGENADEVLTLPAGPYGEEEDEDTHAGEHGEL